MFRLVPGFTILRIAASLFLIATLPQTGVAQDAQYWTYQYGTRANLLSGVVVGSVVDISATYYNPGALALIDEPDIIATQKVFELSSLTLQPDLGFDVDFDALKLDLAPGFLAGLLPFKFLGDQVLAYSFFDRHQFKTTLESARVGSLEAMGDPAAVDFFGDTGFSRDMRESWFGLSWSAPFKDLLGIGVSNFFTYRNQKASDRILLEGLSTDEFNLSLRDQSYRYWNVRLLWKAGVTFDWLGASLGLTITTPSLNLFGDGKVLANRTLFDGDTVFVADFQDGLKPNYESPWSVAFGGTYGPGATTVHLTAEYFTKVDEFTVLDPDPFVGQTTGDTLDIKITQALDDVLNFGFGVEHHFKPHFSGYASFRTDFSAKDPGIPSEAAVSSWNIYFITAGAAVRIGTVDLTAGLSYGFGGLKDQKLVEDGDDGIAGPSPIADIRYRTLRLIIAFAI